MKKIISILLLVILLSAIFNINKVYADDITDPTIVINSMSGAQASNMASADNSIGDIINTVIGLLQVAGTGISVLVVTVLGIKYLIASPSEKADTKKAITPIVIGCVLLFGAVNIMAAISDLSTKVFEE